MSRRGSFEGNDLEEFSHVMLYDNAEEGADGGYDIANASTGDLAFRERELALRQKELALREREYNMRRSGGRMPPRVYTDDDDEDGEDFFDAMGGPGGPPVDAENLDANAQQSQSMEAGTTCKEPGEHHYHERHAKFSRGIDEQPSDGLQLGPVRQC